MKKDKYSIETLSIKDFSNEQIRKALDNIDEVPMIYMLPTLINVLDRYVFWEQQVKEQVKFMDGINVILEYIKFYMNLIESTLDYDFNLTDKESGVES